MLAPALPGCGCAGIGCISGATVSVDLADDLAQLDEPMVTACFNDACASGPLPAFVSPGSGAGIAFPDGAGVQGTLWAPDVDGDRLEVRWSFSYGTVLRAGDRYRVTVTASSGTTVAAKETTALGYDKFETCSTACYNARFAGPSP